MLAPPQVDGVLFRPFRGASDYAEFARLITAFAKGEGSDRVETAEGIAAHYDHLERCDPERDLLVAEVDGRPVAYSRVWWVPGSATRSSPRRPRTASGSDQGVAEPTPRVEACAMRNAAAAQRVLQDAVARVGAVEPCTVR